MQTLLQGNARPEGINCFIEYTCHKRRRLLFLQKATGIPDKMFNACVSFVQNRPEDNKGSSVFSSASNKKFGFKVSNDVAYVLSFLDIFFQGEESDDGEVTLHESYVYGGNYLLIIAVMHQIKGCESLLTLLPTHPANIKKPELFG